MPTVRKWKHYKLPTNGTLNSKQLNYDCSICSYVLYIRYGRLPDYMCYIGIRYTGFFHYYLSKRFTISFVFQCLNMIALLISVHQNKTLFIYSYELMRHVASFRNCDSTYRITRTVLPYLFFKNLRWALLGMEAIIEVWALIVPLCLSYQI